MLETRAGPDPRFSLAAYRSCDLPFRFSTPPRPVPDGPDHHTPAPPVKQFLAKRFPPPEGQLATKEALNMRLVQNHIVNPVNDAIQIAVTDEPGSGGANHRYELTGFDTAKNASTADDQGYAQSFSKQVILFQNGAINEVGVNGVTQEVLLAIVIDRLRAFQAGPFSSRPNALALTHCEEALNWLHYRTLDRMRRGVEGQTKA